MFHTFTSFAEFDGCDDDQHLWCFDCETSRKQNRTYAVSDLPREEAERLAKEYAEETYGDDLEEVYFFDPCKPDDDLLGNFPWWYASEENRKKFMLACIIENSIKDNDSERSVRRDTALDILRSDGSLVTNMQLIEDEVMWHVIRDVLRKESE